MAAFAASGTLGQTPMALNVPWGLPESSVYIKLKSTSEIDAISISLKMMFVFA
jgi:hypothetical protein